MTLPVWSGREGRRRVVQAPLAIVWSCALGVSAYAAAGKLVEVPEQVCPSCGGKLGWWSGYWRKLRESGVRVRIWVRRGRCPPCDVTHALLPDFVVERRQDPMGSKRRNYDILDPYGPAPSAEAYWGPPFLLDNRLTQRRERCRIGGASLG